MKKLCIVPLVFLVSVCFGQTVKVGEFIHVPLAYTDDKSDAAKGAEVAFLTDVLKEAGYTPQFSFVPFPRLLKALESGDFDLGACLTKTAEREKILRFSEQPVLEMAPVLVVVRESKLEKVSQAADVANLKIGFAAGQTLPAFFGKPEALKLDLASGDDTTATNLKKLVEKRVDVILDLNPSTVRLQIKALGLGDSVRILPVPTPGTLFYITASRASKVAGAVMTKVDAVLRTGKYDLKKYIDAELR